MPTPPRVRFAPSPTGYLHVGGARTALFNWLFARRTGGTFVLRIEDTDRERSTDEHTRVILDGLTWLGIDWDEGPYFQGSEGLRHRADAERLLAAGAAYRCFCTREEVDAMRADAEARKAAFRYDGRCGRLDPEEAERRTAAGEGFTVRLRMPDEEIAWDDAVHGRISFQGRDLDDFVILRSDGTPIYNHAVVSDDIAMRITHVIRGDDHISNTPRQIALYRALGHEPPVFAHVPMILGTDGKKLSKRHGATAVGDYQNEGILPAAMRNFLALLGWSPGGDREVMSQPEMIELFSLDGIQGKPAVFDPVKLEWMNGQYIAMMPGSELEGPVRRELDRLGVVLQGRDLLAIIDAVKARSRTVLDIARQAQVRLQPPVLEARDLPGGPLAAADEKARKLIDRMGDRFAAGLRLAHDALEQVGDQDWDAETLGAALTAAAEQHGLKLGDIMQPVRVALTLGTVSEPVNELLAVVGRAPALEAIRVAAGETAGRPPV
jgi:glutamyl-tRNA synthetase